MLSSSTTPPKEVVNFTPPTLHLKCKEPFVGFYARDPISGTMKRKRYMLGRYKDKKQMKFMASQIIANIYNKVSAGWNPWVVSESANSFQPISEVMTKYEISLKKKFQKGVYRKKTMYDYTSRFNNMKEYLKSRTRPIMYAYQVDSIWINEYLDYIYYDRDDTARTRNNHRRWLYAFCEWMIEKRYISENPVINIKPIPEGPKQRQPFPPPIIMRIKDYLQKTDPHFYLACLFQYYTLIRPVELVKLKLKDVSIKDQQVFVSGNFAKNHRDMSVALNTKIIKLMIELGYFKHNSNCYIFGKDFKPSENVSDSRIFRERFRKVRDELHIANCYKFYSFKDSGIIELMNSEEGGVIIARDQARHSSVETTNRYTKSQNTVHEEAKNFEGLL